MPKSKKRRFTKKQDRMAGHVADSLRKKGFSAKKARSIGFATVNKLKAKRKRKRR
jgi:hypothetical protein